ncbi:polymer-forming cytoskeletal protein [Hydrogenophaga sp.]|uniref:bactofilin family protein n=1 Tax=Hydrogenophaga sp. TaxID=1904254 RepID=UPI0027319931|nr:polymer-forming cytoskeletal protein [Hydrogenophaga sp.]MDP2408093.1 polymer-forming cytoskeletal protein [Hydrogenophaga sp.]MDP3886415.1 polymer-forming cytoskeletal protein [Hydrogenophaga sp.]MDZ4176386.1 polymer-forming cytoskeletal protein [Hydrogenophaga sp.]
MALHFGKRETEQPKTLNSGMATQRYGVGSNSASPVAPQASTVSEPAPTPATPTARTSTVIPEGGSKLTVGPNIKLKGVEITDCDTLVVEGLVEATMDSRVIQIAEQGAFKGSAEIDIAEIHGVFDGNLTVRQKLVIYATGRVTGKIRYGKVVIEEGGQLSGDIECSVNAAPSKSSSSTSSTSMPAMALAA